MTERKNKERERGRDGEENETGDEEEESLRGKWK